MGFDNKPLASDSPVNMYMQINYDSCLIPHFPGPPSLCLLFLSLLPLSVNIGSASLKKNLLIISWKGELSLLLYKEAHHLHQIQLSEQDGNTGDKIGRGIRRINVHCRLCAECIT